MMLAILLVEKDQIELNFNDIIIKKRWWKNNCVYNTVNFIRGFYLMYIRR